MNILIITPRIPYPPYRGDKLKIYNISKILAKNNDVTILTFQRRSDQQSEIEALKQNGINVFTVRLSILESLFRAAFAVFTETPFQVAWYKSGLMKKKIRKLINAEGPTTPAIKYDVIYYHLVRSAQYLINAGANDKILNIIDYTDAVSLYLTRLSAAEKNFIKKFFINIEKKRIISYEKIAENFNALFVCSNIDKKFLESSGLKVKIEVLNNGIDTDYFSSENNRSEKNRIIFTGNMPYYPNNDAAAYFTYDIFPLITNEIPDAKFYIVGQKPPLKIKNLACRNIIVTGFVPDIRKEYLKSAVNVAPMRFGAGTLNKVIESVALGVPVVATSIAAQGLPDVLKKFILIADDPVTFSEKVKEILRNNSEYRKLMKEAQRIVKEILSWGKIVTDFENSLKEKLAEKK